MNTSITSLLPKIKLKSHPMLLQGLLYVGLWAGLFFIVAYLDSYLKGWSSQEHLLVLLVVVLLLGIINEWLLRKKLLVNISDLIKTGLTFLGVFLVALLFFIKHRPLDTAYLELYLPVLSFFMLPWVLGLTFRAHLTIPALKYKPTKVADLQASVGKYDFRQNPNKGIRWVFGDDFTQADESGMYHFRTFTPMKVEDILLADLFEGLLVYHNINRNPEQPIDFNGVGWEFCHHSALFFPVGAKALNPEKSIAQNGLRFRKPSAKERAKMPSNLSDTFKYTTIYIKRVRPEVNQQNPIAS